MNKKIKILMTAPYFPPKGGGLEKYVYEISKRFSEDNNYDVVVVSSGERFDKDTLDHIGNIKIYGLTYKFKICNTPFSFGWFLKARKIINIEKPDLINIHMPVPGIGDVFYLVSGKISKIITYHSGTMSKGKSLITIVTSIYERTFLRLMLNKSKKIICSSDYVRFNFLKKYIKKSLTITPGVDSILFIEDKNIKNQNPTIIFVGSLNKSDQYKGLNLLINSITEIKKHYPNIILNVVGDGDMREFYEKRVLDLELNESIKFWGRLNGEKLSEKYKKSHIFVTPSSNESFSMVILEAMSSSLPVIAFDVGSTKQMVEDSKNGFLLKLNEKNLLSQRIIYLINNQDLLEKYGNEGRKKIIDNYDWSKKFLEYKKIIDELLN